MRREARRGVRRRLGPCRLIARERGLLVGGRGAAGGIHRLGHDRLHDLLHRGEFAVTDALKDVVHQGARHGQCGEELLGKGWLDGGEKRIAVDHPGAVDEDEVEGAFALKGVGVPDGDAGVGAAVNASIGKGRQVESHAGGEIGLRPAHGRGAEAVFHDGDELPVHFVGGAPELHHLPGDVGRKADEIEEAIFGVEVTGGDRGEEGEEIIG